MSESIIVSGATKKEKYESLIPQIKALVEGESNMIANLANIIAALKFGMGFFWVGIYFVKEKELVLGPFQGPVACTRIAFGKGVCGKCWETNQTIIVDNVDTFPGHIACSSLSKSEIVLPAFDSSGDVKLILDVDSGAPLPTLMKQIKYILKKLLELLKLFKQILSKSFAVSTVLFIIIILFISSCAQVVAPGGGKKDITPPKAVKYIPDSAQLNFNSKTVQVNFDEFVQLKDLNSQLIISPPMKNAPDISIKNKTLNIVFNKKDTLKPNTTYSISFGNSIQDITEGNPIDNFKYLFSTGTFIDSCSIKGKVQNSFNHSVEKGILVMLYNDYDDSVVYKHLPDYFGKTKDDGSFQINNIKEGKYKLVVLKDGNANYKYDGESESIGFVEDLINVTKREKILIDLFPEVPKKLFLKKNNYESYGKIVFVFNKRADSLQINPLNYTFKNEDVLLQYSKNKDTLSYWFKNIVDKDVLKIQLKNGYRVMDTLEYKLTTKEEALKSKRRPLKLTVLNNFNGMQSLDLNSKLKLVFNNPLDKIGESAFLKQDTILIKNKISAPYNLNTNENTFVPFEIKFKENTKYHLFIPPGTFTDFFGLTNDSIKIDFKTQDEKYYGTVKLKLNIPPAKGQYVLQLLDEKENIIRESIINAGETIFYEYLHPQQYKLKLIYDDNKNGKWDTGNYLKKTQPEKVIYYTGTVNIRSNWDLDLEWKVVKEK